MSIQHTDQPAWLSEKDQESWQSAKPTLSKAWSEKYSSENFDEFENLLEFGYRAALNSSQAEWDDGLEQLLQSAYQGDWNADRGYIRRGFELSQASARPGLIAKPFESLPETPRSAPAVTNRLPEDL